MSSLSQRVEPTAFEAITLLGNKGGWQDWPGKWNTKTKAKSKVENYVKTPAAENEPVEKEKSGKSSKKRENDRKEGERGLEDNKAAKRRSKRIRLLS